MKIVISSGHGKYISGAVGPSPWGLHEHTEAVKVVNQAAAVMESMGVDVVAYEDTVSKSVNENLDRICNFHNAQGKHDLDVSVHFNSTDPQPTGPVGSEVFYTSSTGQKVAKATVDKICAASGLKNRGPKPTDSLAFLNNTNAPAVLVEVCFVNSHPDVDIYHDRFSEICTAIAEGLTGEQAGPQPEPGPEEPPTLRKGDVGPWVTELQDDLNSQLAGCSLDNDGDFGSKTDSAVRDYQRTRGLDADGIVGPNTWAALDGNAPPVPEPVIPGELPVEQQEDVRDIAETSDIAKYSWKDRGVAPAGYIQGMALAFATSYNRLKAGDSIGIEMAKANTGNSDYDALSWYAGVFNSMGMSNETAGPDTLRHLYVLLLGLGMRESSGKHCEGRDMSATNTTSDTCEAGLFQTSYNAHSCSDEFDKLFDQACSGKSPCYLETFKQGVSCSSSSWSCYGSGNGFKFQELCKSCPTFAAETCAITLRNLRKHYGPINERAAEIKTQADQMFLQIQEYLDEMEAIA